MRSPENHLHTLLACKTTSNTWKFCNASSSRSQPKVTPLPACSETALLLRSRMRTRLTEAAPTYFLSPRALSSLRAPAKSSGSSESNLRDAPVTGCTKPRVFACSAGRASSFSTLWATICLQHITNRHELPRSLDTAETNLWDLFQALHHTQTLAPSS